MNKRKVYYLVDSRFYIVAKLVITKEHRSSFSGKCYEAVSWSSKERTSLDDVDTNLDVGEWCNHSEMSIKWDGCSHWYFKGEDEVYNDSYYHLCGGKCVEEYCRFIYFVWKVAADFFQQTHKALGITPYYEKDEFKLTATETLLKDYHILEREECVDE